MTRLARVAACAVLLALSVCMPQGRAGWLLSSAGARLDPGRVFSAGSESLFALDSTPHSMSFIARTLFNLSDLDEPAFRQSVEAAAGSGVANVNLALPQVNAAFELAPDRPASLTSAPVPNESLKVPSGGAVRAVSLRTAEPALLVPAGPPVHFGTYTPYTPSIAALAANVSVPVRVGNMHFETAFHAMQVCGTTDEAAACPSNRQKDTSAQGFSAGTAFQLRNVNVQLSSSVEHVTNQAAGVFNYVPLDADAQAGLTYSGVTDMVEHGVGAQVAVPVTRQITLGLQYDRSHYQGDYGSALLPGFEAYKNTYLGNVTYQLPNASSAITLSARQYRFQDVLAPNFNLTQTRADLNFTVKF